MCCDRTVERRRYLGRVLCALMYRCVAARARACAGAIHTARWFHPAVQIRSLSYAPIKNPQYRDQQRYTAEYLFCHGLKPASERPYAPELDGVSGEGIAADPEHCDTCKEGAERDDVDGYGIHPGAQKISFYE